MSDFIDAYRSVVIATLRCKKCGAMNRLGASVIELDQTGSRVYCSVCSAEGPLDQFSSKEQQP